MDEIRLGTNTKEVSNQYERVRLYNMLSKYESNVVLKIANILNLNDSPSFLIRLVTNLVEGIEQSHKNVLVLKYNCEK